MIDLEKLKAIRQQHNFTLKDMSAMLDISESYYWQVENNKRKLYYDLAIKIAKIFHLKPDELFLKEDF